MGHVLGHGQLGRSLADLINRLRTLESANVALLLHHQMIDTTAWPCGCSSTSWGDFDELSRTPRALALASPMSPGSRSQSATEPLVSRSRARAANSGAHPS